MEKHRTAILARTFDILHSALLCIVLACVINSLYVDPPDFIRAVPFLQILYVLGLIALKIYLLSGIYGNLVALTSQEEPAIDRKSFFGDSRKYWKLYLTCVGLHFMANILLGVTFDHFNVSWKFENFFFDFPLLYFLGFLIIRDKYSKITRLRHSKIQIGPRQACGVIFLFILNAVIINLNHILPLKNNWLSNELIFLYTYILFFTFVYFITLILSAYPEIEQFYDKPREIYLVNPISGGIILGSFFFRFYPPIFVTLKALTPPGYCFREFNKVTWKKRFLKSGKLVAITCFTSNSYEAYKIAKEFRRCGSTVIMGGPHVTHLPDEALQFCDAVVIGEAENVWEDIVHDYEQGALKRVYEGAPSDDYYQGVHTALLNSPPDVIENFLETTRGCKYHCHFCSIPRLAKGHLRNKPIEQIVELIKKINPSKGHFLLFIDNNIISDREYAKKLFEAMIPLKIMWCSQCSIDIAKDDELLALARESGCAQLLIGYEITGYADDKSKKGKMALADQYITLTRKMKRLGISIKAHFIIGFDSDTYMTLWDLWRFCFQLKPYVTVVSVLTPLPGSQLFHSMLKENRIANYNWRYYGLNNLVFKHPQFRHTPFQLMFPVLFTLYLATTCSFGQFVTAIILLDAYFFDLRHFLF
ncbi:MAG: B12-binding domain-containing radical SAM protein [Candidatus Omnitrophica bacterium]|nr:B12-binding domain-containing radical SAM protein [Candidatus Omnitrophota bacterium]